MYKHEESLAEKIKTEPKLFWKDVRTKSKTKEKITQLVMENGELITNDREKAEALNRHFASVFVNEGDDQLPLFRDHAPDIPLTTVEITEEKIVKAIGRLNGNKSAGPDHIHPKFLKETVQQIKKPLKTIFEKSFAEKSLVKSWKKANVTPIFKKGSEKNTRNYRPINITSIIGKLLQRLIRDEIVEHMNANN